VARRQANFFPVHELYCPVMISDLILITALVLNHKFYITGLTKPGEVGDFFALFSMKSPNFCQKVEF
jgi:hypothetical protein